VSGSWRRARDRVEADLLEQYAAVLRLLQRDADATEAEDRAKALRAAPRPPSKSSAQAIEGAQP
jgi:hypothetical protein